MKYSMIATALFGAAIAVPAMPAAYGEGENVYGTQVQAQQTTSAPAAAETTCTDEAEQAVPYTSAVAQAQTTEAAKQPESSAPSYGGAEGYGQESSAPAEQPMTSSMSEASPAGASTPAANMPASSAPAPAGSAPAYSAPMNYGQGSEQETKAVTETMVAQSTVPAAAATTAAAMGSSAAAMGSSAPAGYAASSMASPEMSAPAQQYGSAPVPGATQSAAPYPMGNEVSPAGVAAASGTMGAAMPSGTG